MFSVNESKPVTLYAGSAYTALSRRAHDYATATLILFILAQALLSNYVDNAYGVSIYEPFVFGGGPSNVFYVFPLLLVFGLAYLAGQVVYTKDLHRLRRRFVRDFSENPKCYNCGHPLPDIVCDNEAGDPDDLVVVCPECGAECPAVCVKNGELAPVRARNTPSLPNAR